MNIVIDTCLEVEAGWLPELLHIMISVVIIEEELGSITYQEEAEIVSLKTCIKALEV